MGDFIANGVQTQGLQPIAGMLNLASGAQNLRRGNVELQKEQIQLGERKNIQQLFSNPDAFKGADGDVDYNRLITEGMKVAPTTFPQMIPQIITAHTAGLQAKKALNEVNQQVRDQAGQYIMSIADQPPQVVQKLIEAQGQARPELKPALDYFLNFHLKPASSDPRAFRAAVLRVGQAAMAPQTQVSAITPSGPVMTNNAQAGLVNTNPMAGPTGVVPGTMVNMQLPLSERQTVSTNPVTQSPQVTAKDAFGNVQGVTAAPTGPGVPSLAPGQPQDLPIVTQMRSNVNAAAAQVPTQRFNNRQIIELAPQSLAGGGGQKWSQFFSANGLQWVPGEQTANFQRLGHFMALQAQSNAQAMGAGTDAARYMAEQATGSTGWTPAAIIFTAKINDALATGVAKFNEGMERAIQANGGNVLAARQFQNAWTQAFDPDVYRYGNALETGDQKEIEKILGPKGSPQRAARAKALAEKSARLNQLVTGQ